MSEPARDRLLTRADYAALPDDGNRYQLLEGTAPPRRGHARRRVRTLARRAKDDDEDAGREDEERTHTRTPGNPGEDRQSGPPRDGTGLRASYRGAAGAHRDAIYVRRFYAPRSVVRV